MYFDDFTVAQQSYIVQVDDYYPFGLTHRQPLGDPANRYLFQSAELTPDFGLGWYDFGLRGNYMPDIGRWGSVDPMADTYASYSSYHFGGNNPLSNYEVNGAFFDDIFHNTSAGETTVIETNDNFDRYFVDGTFTGYSAANSWQGAGLDANVFSGYGDFAFSQFSGIDRSHDQNQSLVEPGSNNYLPESNAAVDALYLTSVGLNAAGTASGIGELGRVQGNYWRGMNGKWYNQSWGGNQWTGGRNAVLRSANALKTVGKISFVTGVGVSIVQGASALDEGNKLGAAKSGLDIGMGAVGFAAGPYGLTLSAGYFAVDATIGWDNAMNTATSITNQNRAILGPTWSPYRMGSPFINR